MAMQAPQAMQALQASSGSRIFAQNWTVWVQICRTRLERAGQEQRAGRALEAVRRMGIASAVVRRTLSRLSEPKKQGWLV
jgi:hypothetical protein